MTGSKNRLLWEQLPEHVRSAVEHIAGAPVVAAKNCPGGFSPGMASRLRLADGGRAFAKALDGREWPAQIDAYRVEGRIAAALPSGVPAPRLRGSYDDGQWVALVFEDVAGREPAQPWTLADFDRVVTAVGDLSAAVTPSPLDLPSDHPRLGGWGELTTDRARLARLPAVSAWAADHLKWLVTVEADGLTAAQGSALVHFDLYPHNILLTGERVAFVDWPHARLGASYLDLVTVLSTAPATGIDPEPLVNRHPLSATVDPGLIDAFLAVLAGFHIETGMRATTKRMEPILDAKIRLGQSALHWLARRIDKP